MSGEHRAAESLFVLVRDVPVFEEKFASDVLSFVKDLGFTGQAKEPRRIVQEGCLPFHPTKEAQKVCINCVGEKEQDRVCFVGSLPFGHERAVSAAAR